MVEMRQLTMKMQQAALHYERTLMRKFVSTLFPSPWKTLFRLQIDGHLANLPAKRTHRQEFESGTRNDQTENQRVSRRGLHRKTVGDRTTDAITAATEDSTRLDRRSTNSISGEHRPSHRLRQSNPIRSEIGRFFSSFIAASRGRTGRTSVSERTAQNFEKFFHFSRRSAGLPVQTDPRRMQLDFDQLSSSDEDMSKKKQREKRIRQDMAEHRSTSRVVNTFEHRYNAQMKMLQEQNRLLKGSASPREMFPLSKI